MKLLFQLTVKNKSTESSEMTWVLGRLAALPADSSQVAEPTCIPVTTSSLGRHHSFCGLQHTDVQAHDWKKYM